METSSGPSALARVIGSAVQGKQEAGSAESQQ